MDLEFVQHSIIAQKTLKDGQVITCLSCTQIIVLPQIFINQVKDLKEFSEIGKARETYL